ncbi:MAG: thioredoxin, partial [Bauldia sp.]|nr:thioredoxin [Bauldia sp.]
MTMPNAGDGAAATAGNGAGLIKDTTTQAFAKDVLEESRRQPVLVDFWAPWCGPCKTLSPIIEKAVNAAKGAVKLVKMNIDDHPAIAGQLGIQSIPAVIAFRNGQPVDGFVGALPEGQVKAFIERVAGPAGPTDAELMVEEGNRRLADKDIAGAAELFAAALSGNPQS